MTGHDRQDGGEGGKRLPESDLSARLERLEAQLDRSRAKTPSGRSARAGSSDGPSPLGQAMRLSTEFVAGVIAGGILGWIFDRLLGTRPWGLIAFLLLGCVTGIYNVMRLSGFTGRPGSGSGREKS